MLFALGQESSNEGLHKVLPAAVILSLAVSNDQEVRSEFLPDESGSLHPSSGDAVRSGPIRPWDAARLTKASARSSSFINLSLRSSGDSTS